MNTWTSAVMFTLAAFALSGGPALAKQPDSPGNSDGKKSQPVQASGAPSQADAYACFNPDRRTLIRNYYSDTLRSGHCPPGLAKKNNGCQPPGQIKKWNRGERLPGDVVYYDLPAALLRELGRAPEGERLIRVGTGLLLISVATGMILDVFDIQD